jgi:hypothetical protein
MKRRKRLSSKDFLALADTMWNGNTSAKVKYKNPDGWREQNTQ